MTALGIEFISVVGLPPVQHVELAADLGCSQISTILNPIAFNPQAFPSYSLSEDKPLRLEMIAAMRDRGVSLSLAEGLAIFAETDVGSDYRKDLEIFSELGAKRINVVSFDTDRPRGFDKLAVLTEMAAGFGIETMLEFVPTFAISDLPTALAAIRHVGRPDCRILIDTMHFFRSGSNVGDLRGLDPSLVGYIQLCDAPLHPEIADYVEEATYQRAVPGDGELPLLELLRALPLDRVIGIEVPLRKDAEAGIAPSLRMMRCVQEAKKLLAHASALPEVSVHGL